MASDDARVKRAGRRRAADRRRSRRPRRRSDRFQPRDFFYLLGIGLLVASVVLAIRSDSHAAVANNRAAVANDRAVEAIAEVQQGRRTSIAITCAVLSAISQTGKAVIAGSPKPPPPAEEKALEALGFPPFSARHLKQQAEGSLYVRAISQRVNHELGDLGREPIHGLIAADGSIDCRVLARVGGVPISR